MKKIILSLCFILTAFFFKAQTNADCINAIPLCTTPNFTFYSTAGDGAVQDIPPGSNVSNPSTNPNPPNSGCLLAGENVPQWLILTIGNAGTLEFVFGGGTSANPQVGFYDWAMWPYNAATCSGIMNNTLPPIRCNWNASMSGGTGLASAGNIPPGGVAGNFEAPLSVNACQQFIICISNYSGVNTLVSFQSLGTASLNCSPNCNPSYTICAGNAATITPVNFAGLTGATYSIQPGGQSNTTGSFVVNPSITTTYTTYITGTSAGTAVITSTGTSTVNVNPQPILVPTFTQATCSNSVNAVNLGLGFNPASPVPGYTVNWNPTPGSVSSNTQTIASGLNTGVTSVTVTAAGGCSTTTTFTMNNVTVPTVTVNNLTGTFSLTCATPSINLAAASNYTGGTLNYLWASISFTANTPSVSLTQPGTYTVCVTDPATACSACQTVAIGQNTTAPTTSVNPVSQVITCSLSSTATFSSTAMTPTNNIVHNWYSPLSPPPGAPAASSNNQVSPYTALSPGTHTVIVTDLVNGCSTTKTVNVTSVSGFPTYSTSSTTNYSVGCAPTANSTTLSIINAVSVNSAACQFLFLPPGTASTVPLPSGVFGAQSSTVTTVPGTWTLVVNDPSNSCQTALPVIILQNTIAPHVQASMLTQTLTCTNPTVLAVGSSTTPNTQVLWNMPSTPPTSSTPTIVIGPGTGPNTSTTSLTYASYTVAATNTINACKTTSVVVINQNFRAPVPLVSIGNPSVINCNNIPANLSFTNTAVTSSVAGAFAIVQSWMGPAPQQSIATVAQYSAYVPGVYTLTVRDSYNGCIGTATYNVLDKTQPPVLTSTLSTATLDCGSNKASLSPLVVGGNGNHMFLFIRYPVGAAFTPSTAIIPPGSPASTYSVSMNGDYVYQVTNTVTGCRTTGTFVVSGGDLVADFIPEPSTGYAPLGVNFTNSSSSSLGTGSINSVWSFGNGASQTTTTNISTNSLYTAPGTYTVMLIATKGACIDTAYKVIKVDAPSKLEIPNVFTPNGDGSNDIFFMRTTNLTEITALIYDRWGNKVYDVTSTTGNIAWDGKNQEGKECPSGTYFYIIKATGKDTKTYEQKGNVSLFR